MFDVLDKIYGKRGGIWKYADFYAEKISKENRFALKDGDTPLVENKEINKELKIGHLYFKREDVNETGSLKGRSLAYQVALNRQRGAKGLVISTSGNAGIAAGAYAKQSGLKIFIFISPDTEKGKVADMQKYNPVIIKSGRAIRLSNYAAAKYKLPNLRPSIDDDSIQGFKSIALEIVDKIRETDAIFTFVTSGSSFIGMYRGFEACRQKGKINSLPKMYAVQSGEIHSIAEEFEENACLIGEEDYRRNGGITAGQLGVKNTKRKAEVLEIIKTTGGKGVYASEREIWNAQEMLAAQGLETSLEGCASFAAFIKMHKLEKFKNAVCIFSGKLRGGENKADDSKIMSAESFEEVDRIMEQNGYFVG